jgi:hypothetical protein
MNSPRTDRPDRFERLAVYNAEVGRGIVHTEEYDKQMAALQRQWDAREHTLEALNNYR